MHVYEQNSGAGTIACSWPVDWAVSCSHCNGEARVMHRGLDLQLFQHDVLVRVWTLMQVTELVAASLVSNQKLCGEKPEGDTVEGRDEQLNTLSPVAGLRKESGPGIRLIHPPFPISPTPTATSTRLRSSRNHVPVLIPSYVATSFLYSLTLGSKTNH